MCTHTYTHMHTLPHTPKYACIDRHRWIPWTHTFYHPEIRSKQEGYLDLLLATRVKREETIRRPVVRKITYHFKDNMARIKQISFNFFHFKSLNSNLILNPLLLVSELYVQSLFYLVLPTGSFPVYSVHCNSIYLPFLHRKLCPKKKKNKRKKKKERKTKPPFFLATTYGGNPG